MQGNPLRTIISLKESEIINFYNAMGKKIYQLEGHYYTIDDETKTYKEVTINEADVSPEIIRKLNDSLNPEFCIKHDSYEIITATSIAEKIENIIEQSEEYCFLVTPYFYHWTQLENCFVNASKQKKKIVLFIRDEKRYTPYINEFYEKYNFDIVFIKKLHAKLYVNEHEALITSMNIYEYSKNENYEIGVLIKNKNDLNDIVSKYIINKVFQSGETHVLEGKYYQSLKNGSFFKKNINCNNMTDKNNNNNPEKETISSCGESLNLNNNTENNSNSLCESNSNIKSSTNNNQGHCIYCNTLIPFNREESVCKSCLLNENLYNGKYCHKCGKDDSGRNKYSPLCNYCYRHD